MRMVLEFEGTQYEVMEGAAAAMAGFAVRGTLHKLDEPNATDYAAAAAVAAETDQDEGTVRVPVEVFNRLCAVVAAAAGQATSWPPSWPITLDQVEEAGRRVSEAEDIAHRTFLAHEADLAKVRAENQQLRAASADVSDLREWLDGQDITKGIPLLARVLAAVSDATERTLKADPALDEE